MIEKIAVRISDYWVSAKVIEPEKKDIYVYGLDIILSSVMITCFVAIISLLLGDIFYIVFYYLCFMPLRGYCGGYHAKTHWGCALMQCTCFTVTVILSNLINGYGQYIFIPLFVCMFYTVMKLAPVDHPDNPIDTDKKRKIKRMGIIAMTAISIAAISLNAFDLSVYANIMAIASGVSVLSMIAARYIS